MKTIIKYSLGVAALAMAGVMASCGEYKPSMTPDVPDLPTVQNLKATVTDRVVNLSWQLPATSLKVAGVNITVNNTNDNIIRLDGDVTSYSFTGMPMEMTNLYTVKVRYTDGSTNFVSEGCSVSATVPYEELPNVTGLEITDIVKRTVTFAWTLPDAPGITGVRIGLDGEEGGTLFPGSNLTGGTVKGLKTGVELKFRVQVQYDNVYYSDGVVISESLPFVPTRVGYLLLADSPQAIQDDDEKASAFWFLDNYVDTDMGDFITIAQLTSGEIDFEEYGVIWIELDRVGLEFGWQNMPDGLADTKTINALKEFGAVGGNLFLANMATQMTVPLGIVPESMAPTIYGNGAGGPNPDIWSINPFLGYNSDDASQHYDRTAEQVFAGIQMENINGYPWASLPLIGPGDKEDHNCMWDTGRLWSEAGAPGLNAIVWFENQTNSLVLATWGQEGWFNQAGFVDFKANTQHGRCFAMGLAAYEWNQNSNANIYQHNIEKLTENILNLLK